MFFACDDRNFGWSGAVSRNCSTSNYNKKIKKDYSNRIKSPSNTTHTHQNDFMSKIVKNADEGKSSVFIPATKSESINVDNYIANII